MSFDPLRRHDSNQTVERFSTLNPDPMPNRNFSISTERLAWWCRTDPVETIWRDSAYVCFVASCFAAGWSVYKVWARIKAFIPSLPLELSGCQAAFSTWISRSPLQLIYSYTLYWSLSPRWDRGYTAANFPRTLHTVSHDVWLLLWCTPSISY